jgi:glutaredoxin-like YruB-family protein
MKKVTIYSTPTCHFCHLAKDFMNAHSIKYTDYNVATDMERRKEMVDKTGQMGVPVIDIDGKVMIGFDEASLASALGIK